MKEQRSLGRRKGYILMIVIAATIIMSIIVVGILSRNVSRGLAAGNQTKRIQAELMAKSGMWKAIEIFRAGGSTLTGYTETVGLGTYSVAYPAASGPGLNGTTKFNVTVTY